MKKVTASINPENIFRSINEVRYLLGKEDPKVAGEFLSAATKLVNVKSLTDLLLKYAEPRQRKSKISITPEMISKAVAIGDDFAKLYAAFSTLSPNAVQRLYHEAKKTSRVEKPATKKQQAAKGE